MLTRCCSPPEKVAGGSCHSRSRDAEQAQQELAPGRARLVGRRAEPQHRLGHDVDAWHARDDAQELADEAHGVAAHVERDARLGARQLDPLASRWRTRIEPESAR